mgnify:CR=1 FL=1
MKRLVIFGAGGYGRTVADVAAQSGQFEPIIFLDDDSAAAGIAGKCADFAQFQTGDTVFYPAFGDNKARMDWLCRLEASGCALLTLVHATAYVSPTATIGQGTIVLPHAVVNTGVKIGKGCLINCGAIVDHGCVIEDGVHLCLGAVVKAENRIAALRKIEAGEVVAARAFPVGGKV